MAGPLRSNRVRRITQDVHHVEEMEIVTRE